MAGDSTPDTALWELTALRDHTHAMRGVKGAEEREGIARREGNEEEERGKWAWFDSKLFGDANIVPRAIDVPGEGWVPE